MFKFDKNFKLGHFVVHIPSNTAAANFSSVEAAQEDAVKRNERAKKFGLSCKYVVALREDGVMATD